MSKIPRLISPILAFIIVLFAMTQPGYAQGKNSQAAEKDPVFATIDETVIHYSEFIAAFRGAVRYKYYHGTVPNEELIKFQREVGNDIIEQFLIYRDALDKGIQPNMDEIASGITEYEDRYKNDPRWSQENFESKRDNLVEHLKRRNLLEQMERQVRDLPQPTLEQVKTFYSNNPDKFTEPKRVWVSMLLLAVPPSAANKMWQDAELAAKQFRFRIIEGEDFAALARQYSGHASAVNGGDMGYLHDGMMDGAAHEAIEKLNINDISEPVQLLEGFALFKLNGIDPAKLRPFEQVKERAQGLLHRQLQDEAWNNYKNKLISAANIQVNEELYAKPESE